MSYLFGSFPSLVLLVILFIVVFSRISSLNRRLYILENKSLLEREKARTTPASVVVQQATGVPLQGTPGISASPILPIPPQNISYSPDSSDKFISWVKEDWLLKLGGLLLLIGLGWFTTYAFMNNWIGPAGRITLGIIAGAIILGLGTWRIRKYINQGGIFLVVGSATILLTVFAARELYGFFTPLSALVIMFISTAYISLISVKYNAFAVSLSGLVLAFVAPLLTAGTKDEVGLFSYLFVVCLGAIWIVVIKKNWGALIFSSLVGVSFYSLPFVSNHNHYIDNSILIWFAYGFAAVFFLASIINIINSKETDIKAFLWTAILNGVFLLGWIISFVSAEWQSSIIALWMVIFAIGAFISFSVTKIKSVFFVYAGVALAMLVVATAIELSGAVLTIAYTVESFLVPVLIYFATKDVKASTIGSLLAIGPTLLSLSNLERYYSGQMVVSEHFFVILLVIVALLSLGLLFKKIKETDVVYDFYTDNFLLIVGSVYAYILLWSVLHVAITEKVVATALSLIILIIIALVKYFYGISAGSKILRNYGGALIAFVILRLLFIDVWQMEMGAKIFVFVLIGVLLMSTAFFSRQIKSGFISNPNN